MRHGWWERGETIASKVELAAEKWEKERTGGQKMFDKKIYMYRAANRCKGGEREVVFKIVAMSR